VWWNRGKKGISSILRGPACSRQGRKNGFDTYDGMEEIDRNPTEISKDMESIGKRVGSLHRI
jgi:hypothetical protein